MTAENNHSLIIPDNFNFPYENPYPIQLDFMKSLYEAIELKKIGIFESPTGTGKSLSLICGSLTWLKDFKSNQEKQLNDIIVEEENEKNKKSTAEASPFDWLTEHEVNFDKNQNRIKLKESLEKGVKQEKTYQELKEKAKYNKRKRQTEENINSNDHADKEKVQNDVSKELDEDAEIILAEYNSDDEKENCEEFEDNDRLNETQLTKIYYCSRTHSQLSQFISELRKTKYSNQTRLVTVGSRMNLCINDAVLKLGSLQLVNDRCVELQKTKKNTTKCGSKKSKLDTTHSCPYHKPNLYPEFSLNLMQDTYDIEDVLKIGHESKICSYYGSRHSIPIAEVIALPYNILFQKETRQSFGINLNNQIIIIDEAHNILDTITQIFSIEINNLQVSQAITQLNNYLDRYKAKLAAKNLLYLKQLVQLLNSLNKCFQPKHDEKNIITENGKLTQKLSKIWTLDEFFAETKLYNLNFIKLLKFIDETQLEKKLIGFSEKYFKKILTEINSKPNINSPVSSPTVKKTNNSKLKNEVKIHGKFEEKENKEIVDENATQTMKCPLMQIKQFMKVLSETKYEGRLLLNIDTGNKSTLKFLLLNPNKCFEEIVNQCRSIIFAGGTMKPLSDFEQLIHDKKRIEYFSCDHVVNKENVLAIAMATSSRGVKFDFSYNTRDNLQILDELANELINLSAIVPAGMVVFFVSYDYLDKVINHFKKAKNNFILNKISEKKQIFYEPKNSQDCEKVLNDYAKQIKKCVDPKQKEANNKQTGAILFAVIGGKMSEGINFSDELGRCVVVVGQPYANIKSLELQEKMQYLNKTQPKTKDGKLAGQLYYENLCWKAINQSIGRAIRHANDYASIILIDTRYCTQPLENLKEKLPKWICNSLKQESKNNSKELVDLLVKFFEDKNKNTAN